MKRFVCRVFVFVVGLGLVAVAAADEPTVDSARSGASSSLDSFEKQNRLQQQFHQLEQVSRQHAAEIRQLTKRSEVSGEQPQRLAALKAALAETVRRAFEVRLELQKLELARLEQELSDVRRSIAAREQLRDAIVRLRIESLQAGDVEWEPQAVTTDVVSGGESPVVPQGSRPQPLGGSDLVPPTDTATSGFDGAGFMEPPGAIRSPRSGETSAAFTLRPTTSVVDVVHRVLEVRLKISQLEQLATTLSPNHPQVLAAQPELQNLKLWLNAMQADWRTNVAIARSRLTAAEAHLELTQERLESSRQLHKSGALPRSELMDTERLWQTSLQRTTEARLNLERYLQIQEAAFGSRVEATAPGSDVEPGESTAPVPADPPGQAPDESAKPKAEAESSE